MMRRQSFRFAVRVKPGARRDAVGGQWARPTGGTALLVAVSAPAVDGKANDALRRALAREFGIRHRDVQVLAGERSRDKVVALDPAPPEAPARLAVLLGR